MRNLFLLTTGFPYPAISMETYLETETKYYKDFESVTVLSMGVRKNTVNQIREISGENIKVYPIVFGTKLFYILNGITAFFDVNFYKELRKLAREKRLTIRRIIRLIIYISRSHSDCHKIIKSLSLHKNNKLKNAVLYTYRFEYQPYVMYLLKNYFDSPQMVSRAHRYDLYEERNSDSYIPLRELLLEELDTVYLISDDGRSYLAEKYPSFKEKLMISRLGTLDNGIEIHKSNADYVKIVSCSNVVSVKRVDLIIDALSKVKKYKIKWIHFGGGEMLETIKSCAREKLKSNVSYTFMGKVENAKILDYYRHEDIDLFINLSESEGIPVSIMEALSFGIPCIATDVGGTREIIISGRNGWLLNTGYTVDMVAEIIDEYAEMSSNSISELRTNARLFWEQNYNADKNYREFVKELSM